MWRPGSKSRPLPTTVPDASISAICTLKARAPSLIGRPSAKISKRTNAIIAGGVGEGTTGDYRHLYF